jgi:hypothetical protein
LSMVHGPSGAASVGERSRSTRFRAQGRHLSWVGTRPPTVREPVTRCLPDPPWARAARGECPQCCVCVSANGEEVDGRESARGRPPTVRELSPRDRGFRDAQPSTRPEVDPRDFTRRRPPTVRELSPQVALAESARRRPPADPEPSIYLSSIASTNARRHSWIHKA